MAKKKEEKSEYIGENKIVNKYEGNVLELADSLPIIAKVAKLLGKGRSESYVRKRFGITRKTLQSWATTNTFINNYADAKQKAEEARQKEIAKNKGSLGYLIIKSDKSASTTQSAKGVSDIPSNIESLLKLPNVLKNNKKIKYERYTPEEQDAIMMLLALDGNVSRVAKKVGISRRTLEGWKRRMSVSDRDNFMRMSLLRRANFLDSVSEELETIAVAYCKQLTKQTVINTADARSAASVVKDMLTKLDEVHRAYTAAIPEATKGITDKEEATIGGVMEGESFKRLARLLHSDREGAKEIRSAIADRIAKEKNILKLGDGDVVK